MKMATGSGKTTVMAMLIAWQTVNAARKDSKDFSRAFLIIAPGITIRDRLRVLLPSEPDNYYETREIVPPEMLPEIRRAEIVITNYHAFQHREKDALPKVSASLVQGNAPEPIKTKETDAEMLDRACGKLLNYDRVNVINDEAHHCYRHKVGSDAEGPLTGDAKKEAAENEEAARLWINGIEALDRKLSFTKGVPIGAILYQDQLARAAEKIDIALTRGSEGRLLAVLDPYNPKGSTQVSRGRSFSYAIAITMLCNSNNDQVYPRDVAPPRLGEGALPRDSCGFSGRWDPAWRCLVAKCFNGNNCDEEKPRKTSKYA
jgi:Type III restriction enzyme, res subunit